MRILLLALLLPLSVFAADPAKIEPVTTVLNPADRLAYLEKALLLEKAKVNLYLVRLQYLEARIQSYDAIERARQVEQLVVKTHADRFQATHPQVEAAVKKTEEVIAEQIKITKEALNLTGDCIYSDDGKSLICTPPKEPTPAPSSPPK